MWLDDQSRVVSWCPLAVNIPLAGDRDRLELKLDTEDEDEDVFFLSVTLLF